MHELWYLKAFTYEKEGWRFYRCQSPFSQQRTSIIPGKPLLRLLSFRAANLLIAAGTTMI